MNESGKKRPTIDQLQKLKQAPKKAKKNSKNSDKKTSKKKFNWLVIILWLGILSPVIGLGSLLTLAHFGYLGEMPSVEELDNPKSELASNVITADGVEFGKYYSQNRTPVEYEQISPYLIDALVATEDERYYDHSGIDLIAIIRAVSGRGGGGSTLTQQLAKQLFSKDFETKSFARRIPQKLKEWLIAVQLEKRYTKQEILTMYLNRFDFINQAVGIKSAAQVYFNTTPDKLLTEQAALLAGMVKNPALYNPKRFPERALKRREVVLKQWLKNSNKKNPDLKYYITQSQYDSLRQLPLSLDFQKISHDAGSAPYFREILRDELKNLLNKKNANGDYVYHKLNGEKYNLYRDGLVIYTTIDSRMQEYAENAVKTHLGKELQKDFFRVNKNLKNWPFDDKVAQSTIDGIMRRAIRNSERYKKIKNTKSEKQIDSIFNTPTKMTVFDWNSKGFEKDTILSPVDSIRYYKAHIQSGFMAMDPHNGFIKAWVGGTNYKHFKYDHVKQARRQVGSTFKPFVYATVFRDKESITPCTEIIDKVYCIDNQVGIDETQSWCPKSHNHDYLGTPMSLGYGLANSYNHVTAWVMDQTTPQAVMNLAADMGVDTSQMEAVPAMALGVFNVNVLEMVAAYGTFANKGMYVKPTFISRIEDKNGNTIYEAVPKMKIALDEETSATMLDILKGVTTGVKSPGRKTLGTAIRLRGKETKKRPYAGIKTPIAGKTGTTQNNADGWFIGVTPDLVAGAWSGWEDMAIRFQNTTYGQGANLALPIWAYFMKDVYADKTINLSQEDFEYPANFNNCNNQKNIDDTNNGQSQPLDFGSDDDLFN